MRSDLGVTANAGEPATRRAPLVSSSDPIDLTRDFTE